MDGRIIAREPCRDVLSTVDRVRDALTEVLVVDRDRPVFGFIFRIELGLEVEAHEVGIVSHNTGGGDHLALFGIGQPICNDVGSDAGSINFAAEEELGLERRSFGVAGLLDALDVDVLGIPVVLVLGVDALLVGSELGKDVRAVEPHGVVVKSEIRAKLFEQSGRSGPIGTELENGQEVRARLHQVIHEGVIVKSLNADHVRGDNGDFHPLGVLAFVIAPALAFVDDAVLIDDSILIGALLSALRDRSSGISGVVDGLCRVHEPAFHEVGVVALVVRIADVTGSRNVVMRSDGILLVAVRIVPVLTLAEVERPGEAVRANFPALGSARDDVAVRIVLHEGVDGVRTDDEVIGAAAGKVVHRADFAGVQGAEHLLVREFTTIRAGGHRLLGGGGSLVRCRGFHRSGRFGRRIVSGLIAACKDANDHNDRHQQGKKFLHVVFSPL